ncbi:MAG: transferrin-binding protein-like solute binding protein [Hyphomicrobiales bacterium]
MDSITVPAVSSDYDHVIIDAWSPDGPLTVTELDDGEVRTPITGHYYIYQPTSELPDVLPGNAEYTGELLGDYHDSDQIIASAATGTIEVSVDLENDQAIGAFDVKVAGEDWAVVPFDVPIFPNGNRVEFSGEAENEEFSDIRVRGFFAGSDASELAGSFHLNSEAEFRDNGEVTGVFAASSE